MRYKQPNNSLQIKRKIQGLTQEKLAEVLGVSSKTVGRWERGETYPGDYERKKLCQILQLSEEELGLTGKMEGNCWSGPQPAVPVLSSYRESLQKSTKVYVLVYTLLVQEPEDQQ
jgi:transcriptional regulator with XRE-family HTH domain